MFWLTASVACETVGQIIQRRLTNARKVNYPEWSNAAGQVTAFCPADAAFTSAIKLPADNNGCVTIAQSLDYAAPGPNYRLFSDLRNGNRIVYDNYTPNQPNNPEIHIRFGLNDDLVVEQVKADNGWLYITKHVILPPAPLAQTLPYLGCNSFWEGVKSVGLSDYFESLRSVTILVPNDAAFASSGFNSLSNSQKRATLLYHVLPTEVQSVSIAPGNFTTALDSYSVNIVYANERVSINGASGAVTVLADSFAIPGIIHRIDKVLIPSPMVAADAAIKPSGAVPTAGPDAEKKKNSALAAGAILVFIQLLL